MLTTEDNIDMNIKEIVPEDVDWNLLIQDIIDCPSLMYTYCNEIYGSTKALNILPILVGTIICRLPQHHAIRGVLRTARL
jgi:hypothetical protein